MKKKLLIFIFICIIIIFIKYAFSNYNISYKIKSYEVVELYKNKRFYFEITKGNKVYNFDVYSRRNFTKTKISKIVEINGESFNCIYPVIKNLDTYPLCYVGDEYTDFNLIDSELLDKYKVKSKQEENTKDFEYYNNLESSEYVALWNYKGYVLMNSKSYKNVDLFKKDRYDNTLAYMIDNYIYMPNYDEEHEYSSIVELNIVSGDYTTTNLGYNIDYDSYIVGNVKNKLYIFDNKYSILYEVDLNRDKTTIIGNNEIGYVKYENGKFVSCSKSEYKVDKIKYNKNVSLYSYNVNNGLYKSFNSNNKVVQKINNNNVSIIREHDNTIYYMFEDNFFKYNPKYGEKKVFYNYELAFNNVNTIFIYNK